MSSVRIWLCGGLGVEVDGARVEERLTRRKSRELLGYLVDSDRSVGREELVELLWPEEASGRRDGTFRQLLTEIRQCLGPEVVEGRSNLRISLPEGAWVDTKAAERTLEECRTAIAEQRWQQAGELAQSGLDLLSEEFLAGENGDWMEARRAELEELSLGALEAIAASALSQGNETEAERAARRLVSRAPFRESAYSLLMRSLVALGNPSEALLVYEQLRCVLLEELGTVPSVAMSALHAWVLEQADPGAAHPDAEPQTLYARKADGISIAYQVLGEGPIDLVIVPGFMSHLDAQWTDPAYRSWLRRVTSFARVISLDKAGSGASDPVSHVPSIEDWAGDVGAVLDAAGSKRAILFGASEAGPVAIHYAKANPHRVAGLILYGSLARVFPDPEYLWEQRHEIQEAITRFAGTEDSWGAGQSAEIVTPGVAISDAQRQAWAIFERASGSPASTALRIEAIVKMDARGLLPDLEQPTLVLHRTGDQMVLVHFGRYLAEVIPNAGYVELPGSCHPPYLGTEAEVGALLDAVEEFASDPALAGSVRAS